MTESFDLHPATGNIWTNDARLVVRQSDVGDKFELFDDGSEVLAEIAMTLDRGRTAEGEWQTELSHSLHGWEMKLHSSAGTELARARPTGIRTHYSVSTPNEHADLRPARGDRPWRLLVGDELVASVQVGARLTRTTGRDAEITLGSAAASQHDPLYLLIAALICLFADTRIPAAWIPGPPG